MKAVVYTETGGPDVLRLVDREKPAVRAGQVRVRVVVSAVNPTDWRSRSGQSSGMKFTEQVPHQDGAGVVDAVGDGVSGFVPGQRVWLWDVAFGRPSGTAQEFVSVPARHVRPLPDTASFDVGACLGIPALTAHRTLTTAADGPRQIAPGTFTGRTVLVHGGAGAVGHAAIQLAVRAGATVLTTVSSAEKADLASSAGAHHIINYRTEDVASRVLSLVRRGVDHIVEVDLPANLDTDVQVLAQNGNINVYTYGSGAPSAIPTPAMLMKNVQLDFTYTYTTPAAHKDSALSDVDAAIKDGALRVGTEHGLPLQRYPLGDTAQAHAALERNIVGKVLIDLTDA
ncbi:NADPH:quinone reductase [Amycolatopsis sp. EV170708-02-1]|uniref:NADPH:quinone reductase n=1 Tax=Amycolatopsis sp. EV170708-02-1 TaxID=2919322 RepID=UPI001F0B8D0B|nr:NADPH:quinone reductase [Amycolatopsis sp. EV170708-02-1]UMP00054.1 NADPH:quinone reductase [Amycolatopsis sp. EV170708-02-1]